MALRRRTGQRFETNTWAGFVDAMTALLLVIIFVLSIFMIMQFFLRETIKGQAGELTSLEGQLANLADVLGATRAQNDQLNANNSELEDRISRLQFEFEAKTAEVASFEEQVASLIARNTKLTGDLKQATATVQSLEQTSADLDTALLRQEELVSEQEVLLSEKEKLERALAASIADVNKEQAEARLAAERANALEALVNSMNTDDGAEIRSSIEQVLALASLAETNEIFAQTPEAEQLKAEVEKLTKLEQARLADQAATAFLREKLQNSDTELTAMTLALEQERQKAEDTLTLLAAVDSQKAEILNSDLSQDEKDAALLALANEEIALRQDVDAESARRIALLNEQTAQLRAQLGSLQNLLDSSAEQDAQARVQLEIMGTSLNAALARAAAEQKKRADSLESYRSEFFGSLREVLSGVEGVSISGDRFVFSSEVLFPVGSSELSDAGRAQIGQVAQSIRLISEDIPSNINWVLRVDGHTDILALSNTSQYADNWELSQARALSVVRYMISAYGVDPKRLAAAGFGEFHPVNTGRSPEALAQNRRIELKLTEQ